jgi:uncharacterized protein (TIGR02284 family)
MRDQDKAVDVLYDLAETCRNGHQGYLKAAELISDPAVRTVFNEFGLERATFAAELENELIRLGIHDPDRKGTAVGALHRTWLGVKDALGGDDGAILSSVEAAEDHAKQQYEKATKADLSNDVRELVSRQAARVFAAHDRVRDLRDEYKQRAA